MSYLYLKTISDAFFISEYVFEVLEFQNIFKILVVNFVSSTPISIFLSNQCKHTNFVYYYYWDVL